MADPIYATCRDCAREDIRIAGRGLCAGCYDRHWNAGTLDLFPKASRPPKPIPTHKPCALCQRSLPLDDFARNNRRPDGHGSYCKSCARDKYHVPAREKKREVPRPTSGEKQCTECERFLDVSQFYWQADKGRFANKCKSCRKIQDKAYRETDPLGYRDKVIRRKYGIGLAEFDEMVEAQGGGCAICGISVNPDASSLAVDHCHTTGRVRGILCGPCNKAIGLLQDDPLLLEKAAIYLRK